MQVYNWKIKKTIKNMKVWKGSGPSKLTSRRLRISDSFKHGLVTLKIHHVLQKCIVLNECQNRFRVISYNGKINALEISN